MKITKEDLRRIIVEEYIKEESLDEDNVDDLLDWIKGGEQPDWAEARPSNPGQPPKIPPTDNDDTQPMDIPSDDAPESEHSGFQDRSDPGMGPDLAAAVAELVYGKSPDEVGKIFDTVYAQLSSQEAPKEEPPETLYVKGAEGRPAVGFKARQLEELKNLIREVMTETEWYDIFAGETAAPHSTGAVERKDTEDEATSKDADAAPR